MKMLRRRFNSSAEVGREAVERLVAARNSGSIGDVAELLREDARYWDCVRGEIAGRDEVAAILCAAPVPGARLAVEALAVDGGHAVAELSAVRSGLELRTTEAFALEEDGIAWCRAYFDPAEVPDGD